MFLRLPNTEAQARRRLAVSGIDMPDVAEWADMTESGVRLSYREVTPSGFAAKGVITVRKNCVAVHLNPAVSEALGYQPGGPLYLQPGWHGELEWTVLQDLTDAQVELIGGLDWLVELSVIPVAVRD